MTLSRRIIFAVLVALVTVTVYGDSYVCRAIDMPGSSWTQLWQINNKGQVVASSDLGSAIYNGVTWTPLPPPPSGFAAADLTATGINDAGAVTGAAYDNSSQSVLGFLLNGGTYEVFIAGAVVSTVPRSISTSGVILGYTDDGSGVYTGFRRDPNGALTAITPPTYNGTAAFQVMPGAMNDAGQFVGTAWFGGLGPGQNGPRGFIYEPSSAQFTLFRVSGERTYARGINNRGAMTATTVDAGGNSTSWIMQLTNVSGQISCSGIPSASGFIAESINDAGVVSGDWTDAAGNFHGFLAYPDATAALDNLIVASTGVGPGKSLASKAREAKTDYAAGDTTDACAVLSDYIAEVRAQTGKSLTTSQESDLVQQAKAIMQILGCS